MVKCVPVVVMRDIYLVSIQPTNLPKKFKAVYKTSNTSNLKFSRCKAVKKDELIDKGFSYYSITIF